MPLGEWKKGDEEERKNIQFLTRDSKNDAFLPLRSVALEHIRFFKRDSKNNTFLPLRSEAFELMWPETRPPNKVSLFLSAQTRPSNFGP